MNYEEVLFENYFIIESTNDEKENKRDLNFVINLILNSKEFQNTGLKISSSVNSSVLISLHVKVNNDINDKYTFSGLYYITDGINIENRAMVGTISVINDKIFLVMQIDRFMMDSVVSIDLGEIFTINSLEKSYERFSSYSENNNIEITTIRDFDKFCDFKEKALKRLK